LFSSELVSAGKASLLQAKKNPTCKSGTKLGVKSSVVFIYLCNIVTLALKMFLRIRQTPAA
jgi:hypothetical protein